MKQFERTQGQETIVARRLGVGARASTVLGLTVLFGGAMTGQAFSEPAGSGRGNDAQKVALCHATGSATNPYVSITISENGLHGHDGHDGDIIPAPAGGCPGPAPSAPTEVAPAAPAHEVGKAKVTLCHATGSATNPYVVITISENGLHGHDGHDGDIIPAPADGCPRPAPAASRAAAPARVAALSASRAPAPARVAALSASRAPAPAPAPAATPDPTPAPTISVAPASVAAAIAPVATAAGPGPTGVSFSTAASNLGTTASPAVAASLVPAVTRAGTAAVLGTSIERLPESLPRTGGESANLAMAGLGLLVIGGALKWGSRRVPVRTAMTGI